jgi:adenylate cyclase
MTKSSARRGIEFTPAYTNSPVFVVDETERPFRQKLEGAASDFPLLRELYEDGGTDYVIFPLPFLDRTRSAYVSYASDAVDGFSDSDLAALEVASALLSPYAERVALRQVAIDLLDTYVGHHAGERIFEGQIRRGAAEEIEAAILMADLRGFTEISNRSPRETVIEMLNAWFDVLADAIGAQGGEILKFMGDGLLAVFPSDDGMTAACTRAIAAAEQARGETARINVARAEAATQEIAFVMGLHVGTVAYGNVGSRTRLDFTVLGPKVNYASRLQDLAKQLGETVLVSNAVFARGCPGLVDLGSHAMRGIGDAERVFSLSSA